MNIFTSATCSTTCGIGSEKHNSARPTITSSIRPIQLTLEVNGTTDRHVFIISADLINSATMLLFVALAFKTLKLGL
jgi:hypothetical protein